MARTEAVDIHGVHEIDGPLLVGGAGYLAPRCGLFTEYHVLKRLRTEKAFRAYLELREEAFKKAANELVSAFNSPADLFFLTAPDVDLFRRHFFNHRASVDQYSIIVDDEGNRIGVDNIPTNFFLDEDEDSIRHKIRKVELLDRLYGVRRYYAYRKSLLKLDFIQWNSDPEEVLKRIKSSNRWSELDDRELKLGLKSHMDLLKELKSKLGSTFGSSSISEYENVALERINSEMGSELETHLYHPQKWLMYEYFDRMKLMNLARECSTQAEKTGIILVEEFMPVRVPVKEQIVHTILASMKQAVEQSVEGWMGYLRGGGAARGKVKHSVKGWMGYLRGSGAARGKGSLPALAYSILGATIFGMANNQKLRTAT